jgi:hypothetical protein
LLAFYNPLQQSEGDENGGGSDVVKAKKREQAFVRYSPAVVKMIQDLPNKNTLEVEVSSKLSILRAKGHQPCRAEWSGQIF